MEGSYCSKTLKYQSLILTIENLGYKWQLIVLVFAVWVMYKGWRSMDYALGGISKMIQTVGKILFNLCN